MNTPMTRHEQSIRVAERLSARLRKTFVDPNEPSFPAADNFRVVLYSHDTMGVGHMRRNLLIASQIKRVFPGSSALVIAGAKEASTFSQNAGIDCLTLPAFNKNDNGAYTTRNLDIPVQQLLNFRSRTLLAAIQNFQPDLLIVDKVPAGAGGEMLPTLNWLYNNSDCQCVLGLRDILDEPEVSKVEWAQSESDDIVRQYFDSIWVYGDPRVHDLATECCMATDLISKVTYTGYLNTESRLNGLSELPYEINVPYVLCTVGGGQDGLDLSLNFIEAIRQTGKRSVLLTGPCMPDQDRAQLRERAADLPALKIVEFADEGDLLIKHASHVVSMAGYNTVAAILSHNRPAFLVPRIHPRKEQLIRAERLSELDLVTTLSPDVLRPQDIAQWLSMDSSPPQSQERIEMNGLGCIAALIQSSFSLNSTGASS